MGSNNLNNGYENAFAIMMIWISTSNSSLVYYSGYCPCTI